MIDEDDVADEKLRVMEELRKEIAYFNDDVKNIPVFVSFINKKLLMKLLDVGDMGKEKWLVTFGDFPNKSPEFNYVYNRTNKYEIFHGLWNGAALAEDILKLLDA